MIHDDGFIELPPDLTVISEDELDQTLGELRTRIIGINDQLGVDLQDNVRGYDWRRRALAARTILKEMRGQLVQEKQRRNQIRKLARQEKRDAALLVGAEARVRKVKKLTARVERLEREIAELRRENKRLRGLVPAPTEEAPAP